MTFVYGPCRVWIGDVEAGVLDVQLSVATPPIVDVDVDQKADDPSVDLSGWYCVKTLPYPCPAPGCTFVAEYMTAAHMIVVWPSIDDPVLLSSAHNAKLLRRDPRIVEYEVSMGPCIAYDEWERLGCPVHAVGEKPDGWDHNVKRRL